MQASVAFVHALADEDGTLRSRTESRGSCRRCGGAEHVHGDVGVPVGEVARGDEAIAAVVAGADEHEHAPTGDDAEVQPHLLRDGQAGLLHEFVERCACIDSAPARARASGPRCRVSQPALLFQPLDQSFAVASARSIGASSTCADDGGDREIALVGEADVDSAQADLLPASAAWPCR